MTSNIQRARPLLGTVVEIIVAGTADRDGNAAVDAAFDVAAHVHRLMSFHEAGSDVSWVNREAERHAVQVHRWTYDVLKTALDLYRRSRGLFDIAIAPTLQALEALPKMARDVASPATPHAGSAAIELLPDCRVRFHESGIMVDLGGIAKGFAVDRAVEALKDQGVALGFVNAGGDIAVFGSEAYPIQIRDPREPWHTALQIDLKDEAVASSGPSFDPVVASRPTRPAILDPFHRIPAHAIVGASVCAPSCMVADALTKIVMLSGERCGELLRHYNASAMFVAAGGEIHMTKDWRRAVHLAA
ncbi:MAG: FAD:protein FMN transferase [Alphaproteobacteria bacterium]|nr:FAD:protein FMN transferase [Alphaproteobacteria bacterium]